MLNINLEQSTFPVLRMEGIEGIAHPLDTPLILESIFKKLGVSDLKTCRQLNRVWHETATKCMRPAVTVIFGSRHVKGSQDRMRRFMDLVQSDTSTFEGLPITSDYKLCDVIHFPKFWAFCGSSIKSLHLNQTRFLGADFFRHAIFQSCPNLENLVLDYITVATRNNEEVPVKPLVWVEPQFPQNKNLKRLELRRFQLGNISFLELFSYFPSIEEIHLDDFFHRNPSRIFQALATCREHDSQSWNIKKISFGLHSLSEPETNLRFLSDDRLSLETLAVSGLNSSEHTVVLRNILNANATTLKSLKLEGDVTNTFNFSHETVLEKLVIFSLHLVHITSLNFLCYLPNLKKLELLECTFSHQIESSEEPLNHWVISSCKELTVNLNFENEEVDLVPLFRRITNVEKLRVRGYTREMFQRICENFPNLVYLELNGSSLSDSSLTGLDWEDVERINEDENLDRRSVTVPRPNLSSLKNLKWFSYKSLSYRLNTLGFCAAQCGVLQLPQLQHLKVERCEERIWDHLHDQFPWRDPGIMIHV